MIERHGFAPYTGRAARSSPGVRWPDGAPGRRATARSSLALALLGPPALVLALMGEGFGIFAALTWCGMPEGPAAATAIFSTIGSILGIVLWVSYWTTYGDE